MPCCARVRAGTTLAIHVWMRTRSHPSISLTLFWIVVGCTAPQLGCADPEATDALGSGSDPGSHACGNGKCAGKESCTTCPADCGVCSDEEPPPDDTTPPDDPTPPEETCPPAGAIDVRDHGAKCDGSNDDAAAIQAAIDAASPG